MKKPVLPNARIGGRKGTALRKKRLSASPICAECIKDGFVREALAVDHIVPLAFGGEDIDSNTQNLCHSCHDIKTAYEASSSEAASNHPSWLKPSYIPLTIVCGPPCSGKTTYVRERARENDSVIDLDSIMMIVKPGYQHWSGELSQALFNRAIRVRNALLGSLHRKRQGKAWFIVSAPTKNERDWWHRKLGGDLVLLDPGLDECKTRAVARGTPKAADGAVEWFKKAKSSWLAPEVKAKRQAIGLDGWAEGD